MFRINPSLITFFVSVLGIFLTSSEPGICGVVSVVEKPIAKYTIGESHVYGRYVVRTIDDENAAGQDVKVCEKSSNSHSCAPNAEILNLKNDMGQWFAGVSGKYLFIDLGTSAGPRGIDVYDLESKKKIFSGSYTGSVELKGGQLHFWSETGEANRQNCPEIDKWQSSGGGAAIETRVIFDLEKLTLSKTKEVRCEYQE
ncbi:MAG: hypothetical protein AABY52_04380 [Deltaproteobacteria bacterium]